MKYVISENQVDKIKSKIHEYIKKYGFEQSRQIFGDKVLFTIGFNNDPMEFLNLFNDLKQVQSIEEPDLTLFRYKKGENIMYYDEKYNEFYFNHRRIWKILSVVFGLKEGEIKDVTKEWVEKTHNLTVTETFSTHLSPFFNIY